LERNVRLNDSWPAFTLSGYGAAAFAFSLRFKRRLVEAAGVEPASGKLPLKLLHAYPGF
jgi:hypothetical protein